MEVERPVVKRPASSYEAGLIQSSWIRIAVFTMTSGCALTAANHAWPDGGTLAAASSGWGLSLWSMALVASMTRGPIIAMALRMVWAMGIQSISYVWLSHMSYHTAHFSLLAFDAIGLWRVVEARAGYLSLRAFTWVAGIGSLAVGMSLSPHGFDVKDAAIMGFFVMGWVWADIRGDQWLSYVHESRRQQATYPWREERLKTQTLIGGEVTALLALVPFYVDRLPTLYLLWVFLLGLMYVLGIGTSVAFSHRMIRPWQRLLSWIYLGSVFICLALYSVH
ncbi:hypothetical protein BXT84_02300 [Sulfobacillus thermotolerans]|uniref:Uncharacterized protein n=1 Tax=Sulfobacillus thermotolerans TaxID=338644 RepID=A0ABN5GWN0_9FIRM|nr:hypothetical protein BXT84_02300 [Sulfobacillus thermotolerans]